MNKQETLDTIWEVPDEVWERIDPTILKEDSTNGRAANALILDRRSMASFFACVAVAN